MPFFVVSIILMYADGVSSKFYKISGPTMEIIIALIFTISAFALSKKVSQ